MALRAKVLQKKAEKFEAKKLQVHKVIKEQLSALEPLLQDVYANRRPKPTDYNVRRDLVRVFNEIAKEIYGNSKDIPVVVEFGSFVMDLFSNTSDLDLSINFSTNGVTFPREKKIQTLRKFAKKLYAIQSEGHVCGVLPITTAKVPILKCVDRGTGVECDISVENRDGISKSQIIHSISLIDERFHKLSFLMKTWAKAHNINSSKDKTLNSLSIIMLVAFHMQTRSPPILPPFSAMLKDGSDPASVVKLLPKFGNYGERNQESLAELFVTLLIKLSSIENLWAKGLCASTYDATWTSKTWDSKVACISVEDFTDRSQNVARAVGQAEVKQIYKCIDISIQHIFAFMEGNITGDGVRDLLFGQDGIPTGIPPNLRTIAALSQPNQSRRKGKRRKQPMHIESALPVQSFSTKKMRTGEGWVRMPSARWGAPVQGSIGTQQPNVEGWGGTQQPSHVGWGGTQQPSHIGWGRTQQPSHIGWGGTQQPSHVGLVGTQQLSHIGWDGIQQPSPGGWGGTQQPSRGVWGGTQQPSHVGWGGTQQPSHVGWGGTQQPSHVGWGGTQQPSHVGWGGTQQPSDGGWGGTQLPSVGGWGGVLNPQRTTW